MPLTGNDLRGSNRDRLVAIESARLFTSVSPEDFKRISAAAHFKQFERGEMQYLGGDMVEQVLLLISGFVKITQLGPRRAEVILRLSAPGDVLGAVGLFSTDRHLSTAQAIRRCGALVWGVEVFKDLVECLPVLHKNITRLVCGHLQELEERFRELATERVAPRVARQLVRLQEQFGSPQKSEMEIGLTLESLAQMTGTTEYTVRRLLSAWQAHGFVTWRCESVRISDVRALREIFEES